MTMATAAISAISSRVAPSLMSLLTWLMMQPSHLSAMAYVRAATSFVFSSSASALYAESLRALELFIVFGIVFCSLFVFPCAARLMYLKLPDIITALSVLLIIILYQLSEI